MINETYLGYRVIVDDELMSNIVEDWSNVRSYGRAVRRRKRGFRQNIIYRKVPKPEAIFLKEQNTMIMHSDFYYELKRKSEENAQHTKPYWSNWYRNPPMGSTWRINDGQYGGT